MDALVDLMERHGGAMPCRGTLKRVWVPMTRGQHRLLQGLLPGVKTLWDEPRRCKGWGAFVREMDESDGWDEWNDDEEEEEEAMDE